MKLSVILPVYNKIRYAARLLEQLRAQTFTDFEALLIDDGSTDGSGQVFDRFAAMDDRFRVFHIPNAGVSHARNLGLDAARGTYITFLDGDDRIREDHLENLVRCIEESGAELVISGFERISADGTVLQRVVPAYGRGNVSFRELLPCFAREQRQTGIFGYCFSKIVPRSLLEHIRFDESLVLAEDFDFWLELYAILDTVCLDDHTGYGYLQNADNSTGNTPDEEIDYLAQLRINLHYRSVLRQRGAYSAENRQILDQRLGDYAYFVLFHTPLPCYRERFETLCRLWQEEQIPLHTGRPLGKWLFFCLRRRQCGAARLTMGLYRMARSIKRAWRQT